MLIYTFCQKKKKREELEEMQKKELFTNAI